VPAEQTRSAGALIAVGGTPMRYTVHAEWPERSGADTTCVSAIEALGHASQQIVAGATGVYIYDDLWDEVYWPDHFPKLMSVGAPSRSGSAPASRGRLSRIAAWLKSPPWK
jgi:hypothetical protein